MQYSIIQYNNRPLGESGEPCKSEYDFSTACNTCGTGAVLTGNLRVKGFSKINKDFFATLDGDYIISKRLYGKIRDSYKDLTLLNVIDMRNKVLVDYYHLTSKIVLPRFQQKSTGLVIEKQCPECKRNGFFSHAIIGDIEKNIPTIVTPYNFIYKRFDFESIGNSMIIKTWECAGLSNKMPRGNFVIRYARPWIIVNQQIRAIFDQEKISNIEYENVIIE
jgi:hypothetical protein